LSLLSITANVQTRDVEADATDAHRDTVRDYASEVAS
jgi:hypothetical protein